MKTIEKVQFTVYRQGEIPQNFTEQAKSQQNTELAAGALQMLPFTFEKYPLAVVAHLDFETFVGINAIIAQYKKKVIEQGALYISPEYRGSGLTWPLKAAFNQAVEEIFSGSRLITFANPVSKSINEKQGFKETTNIPKEALTYCAQCPKKKDLSSEKSCCDIVLEKFI